MIADLFIKRPKFAIVIAILRPGLFGSASQAGHSAP